MERTIGDFFEGDRVYHLSQKTLNSKQIMIVKFIKTQFNRIVCSWITIKGHPYCEEFYLHELDKLPKNNS